MAIGLDNLVGSHPAYINVTRRLLLAVDPLPLPPDRVVLELLETEPADPSLLAVLGRLTESGFRIALDDFTLTPDREALLRFASIVKLDVQALGPRALVAHFNALRGRQVTLIAEKVETRQQHARYLQMGFDAFQGFYYAKPRLLSAVRMRTHRLDLLARLLKPERTPSFEQLRDLIVQDAGLSHQFLRLANSAFYTARSGVHSIHDALMRIGTVAVHRWLLVMTMAQLCDRPGYLLNLGLQRAHLCERLASQLSGLDPEACFTVGLLSVVDALAGQPMGTLLDGLPLDPALTGALLHGHGSEGALLSVARDLEHGRLDTHELKGLDEPMLTAAYRRAVRFADISSALLS